MSRYFLIGLMCLVMFGCSNVKDLTFDEKNTDEVLTKIKKSKDLTGEETSLLTASMVRYALTGEKLAGKKVKDLIDEQKKIVAEAEAKEKEAKRLAAEAAKKEAAVAAELSKYLVVAPVKKTFHKADIMSGEFEDAVVVQFVFENKGAKDIEAFKGTCRFNNLFGEEIRTTNLYFDDGVKAGQQKKWVGTSKFNQFMHDQVNFRNTELDKMKFEWIPKAIIFTDGSTLGDDHGA